MTPMNGIIILIALVSLVSVTGIVLSARAHWISVGKNKCENAAAVATQEKVIDNDKKLRPIRSHRPSVERVADRMLERVY